MVGSAAKFIFVFLDGVGLGQANSSNLLAFPENTPFLYKLLEGPLTMDHPVARKDCLLKPIDACLGVPGLPQSATGQTALYTGRNAPQFRGQHQTGFANGSLRQLIEESGLFKQVLQQGGTATLANLYSPQYFYAIAQRRIRYSVGTLLNLTAGLPFRMQWEYAEGVAVFWDITGALAPMRGIDAPPISPREAGARLANISRQYTVTLFESYLPDFAGHAQNWQQAEKVLFRIDQFLESLVRYLPAQTTLIVSSDHGNVEDLSIKRHTLNPVPLLVVGPQSEVFQSVEDITGIAPTLLQCLECSSGQNG